MIKLNEEELFILYRGMVCDAISKNEKAMDLVCGDVWGFTESLDMSFEEHKHIPVKYWKFEIQKDLHEFVNS